MSRVTLDHIDEFAMSLPGCVPSPWDAHMKVQADLDGSAVAAREKIRLAWAAQRRQPASVARRHGGER